MSNNLKDNKSIKVPSSSGISVSEAGRRGGQSTLRNQGVEHFRQIGRKGGQRTAELYRDLLCEFGKRGGRPKRPILDLSRGEEDR
jgi:general stress protein YciG